MLHSTTGDVSQVRVRHAEGAAGVFEDDTYHPNRSAIPRCVHLGEGEGWTWWVYATSPARTSPPTHTRTMLRGVRRSLHQAEVVRALRLGPNVVSEQSTSARPETSSTRNSSSSSRPETRSILASVSHRGRLYSQLSKYRLSALVMSTTSAGYLAAGGPVDAVCLGAACLGTMLASSSANCFNQVIQGCKQYNATVFVFSYVLLSCLSRGLARLSYSRFLQWRINMSVGLQ